MHVCSSSKIHLGTKNNLRNIFSKHGTVCPQMTEPFSTHSLTTMVMISFLLSLNQSEECIRLHQFFIFGNNKQWIDTGICHGVRATDLKGNIRCSDTFCSS